MTQAGDYDESFCLPSHTISPLSSGRQMLSYKVTYCKITDIQITTYSGGFVDTWTYQHIQSNQQVL
jgi:hypothetical protein